MSSATDLAILPVTVFLSMRVTSSPMWRAGMPKSAMWVPDSLIRPTNSTVIQLQSDFALSHSLRASSK